jgi:hypothetical protein
MDTHSTHRRRHEAADCSACRFIFDAGEWQAPIGEHKDPSGVRRIMLTGPPFAGFAFWPQQNEGKTMLLFETAQQKYWFERPAATAR